MANLVTMKIDGKEVQVPEGMNLIDAAESVGVHIPNLCYLKGLKGIGACRMCLIEVEGMKAPMTACTMKTKEGMSILTNTERVQEVRKFVIDLIVSMHPLDCMTCTKAGHCNLQNYAYDFEIQESTFSRKKFGFGIDDRNPFIKLDPDYCILCGRCVRICKYQGTSILEFMGRGVGSKVTTANGMPLHESGCTFCGSCIDVCPVNAILEADRWRKGREWDYDNVRSACLLCGDACDITVSTKNGEVRKINADVLEDPQTRYICAYGRFGFDCIGADTRVTSPMKRTDGELVETTWEDALDILAKKLRDSGSEAGFISTGGILNEDALTLKRFATEVVGTENIDTTVSLYADAESMKSGGADIASSDLIMLVGLNPSQWNRVLPATDAIIRKRVSDGAKLIVVNSKDTKVSEVATINIMGDEALILSSIAKALISKGLKGGRSMENAVMESEVSEEIEKASSLFAEAKNPVILSSPSLYDVSANIALMKGIAVSVPIESNAKGVILMGLVPQGKTYIEMTRGETELLYAIGEVPITQRPDVGFLVVQNSHLTELARQADIVLPSAAYLEVDGTIVDYLGRLKHVCKAVEPAGDARPHREIFVDIARAIGADVKMAKEAEVRKLAKTKAKPEFRPFKKKEGIDVSPEEMIESINASVINGSRLLWLREMEKAVV
ncbi:MAG: molybdopterin-dependent oxidoreductase [Thermodesulfovibrionales bacterium]